VIEADEFVALVEHDADCVEADLGGGWAWLLVVQECAGHLPDLPALAVVEGVPDRARPPRAARLDLDEHERAFAADDEIDLTEPGPVVTSDDGVAQALEVLERTLLTAAAEEVTGIG
jgi:hypothetical protein